MATFVWEAVIAYLFQQLNTGRLPRREIREKIRQANTWLASKIKEVSVPKILRENKGRIVGSLNFADSIGRMFMFVYDPKHKATLPYYDKFPLIFPIEHYDDGFLGINMHYLDPPHRAALMKVLWDTANNDKLNHTTKLEISYGILKSAAKYASFVPCIHRYLNDHVRSGFVYLGPDEWDMALLLPTERFAKKSKANVWRESNKIIARGGLRRK